MLTINLGSSNDEELPAVRKSYQEFLHSLRNVSKSSEENEQLPLFEKVSLNSEATTKDNLKVQDISSEEEQ